MVSFLPARWPVPVFGTALMLAAACSATGDDNKLSSGSNSDSSTGGDPGAGAGGNATGGGFLIGGSGQTGGGGIIQDPCDTQCGDVELCDGADAGLDNNCDGTVDEGCPCTTGAVQSCFKGDPAFLSDPGCFAGTQSCSEFSQWNECVGGVHATEMCFTISAGCHAIQAPPFVTTDLHDGLGTFGSDAVSETFEVACPANVNPCPTPMVADYTALQSGEYSVTYTKTLADSSTEECTFPLFIGAPGLRVELVWEWDDNLGDDTVDLDLHLHKPNDTNPWGGSQGNIHDCAYDNCTAFAFDPFFPSPFAPQWFSNTNTPPDPVNWFLSPVLEDNTCYFGPKGNGALWQGIGLGCHNPRLDIDNITCNPLITDPQNFDFCNPENINIDYPPTNEWTRIGVNYYSSHSQLYDVHPVVKVFCDGALAAELGPNGYNQPVAFTPSMGENFGDANAFWLVADVVFLPKDECEETASCVVQPLFQDVTLNTPLINTVGTVTNSFGPAYPPLPMP